jgi:DNA repair protein RadC
MPAPGGTTLRERLLEHGPQTLTVTELIDVVSGGAGSGSRIGAAGGLRALAQADPREVSAVLGLGPARAARLLAALELGRRAQRPSETRPRLRTPAEIFRHVWPSVGLLPREVFHVLCFNPRNVLLADVRIAEGTVDSCPVDPREVFRAALTSRASAVVLVHNHPSGDPEPSAQDVTLTRQLVRGAELLGLKVLDHLVVGDGAFSSMLEQGRLGRMEREARAMTWQDGPDG